MPSDLYDLILDLNSVDNLIREAAYGQLLDLGGEIVPDLVEMFPDIAGAARLLVIRAFGEIGHLDAAPLLAELVTTDDPHEYLFVASLAARSLGQIGAIETLAGLLDHRRSGPRRMAATVLKNLCDERATPALIRALRDEDSVVRAISRVALECIGTPQAWAALDAHRADGG